MVEVLPQGHMGIKWLWQDWNPDVAAPKSHILSTTLGPGCGFCEHWRTFGPMWLTSVDIMSLPLGQRLDGIGVRGGVPEAEASVSSQLGFYHLAHS